MKNISYKRLISIFITLCVLASTAALKIGAYDEISALAETYNIRDYSVTATENGITNTVSSNEAVMIFEAGSISKPVTAYICLELVSEGRLSLDDKITKFLSGKWVTNDARIENITIRQLLSHTAGFSPSYEFGVDRKIYFAPGSRFSYSGVGYIYLQEIIENVYGGTLEEAAEQYVFEPLKMENSTFAKSKTITPYVNSPFYVLCTIGVWLIASIVVFIIGMLIGLLTKFKFFKKMSLLIFSIIIGFVIEVILLGFIMPRMIIPALIIGVIGVLVLFLTRKLKKKMFLIFGGFMILTALLGFALPLSLPIGPEFPEKSPSSAYSLKSTSQDLALFADELISIYNSDFDEKSEMFKPQTAIDGSDSWGAGLGIETVGEDITFWHSGINPGMQSLMVIEPKLKKAVVIMTNSDNGLSFADSVAENVLDINGQWDVPRNE
jgi:CubicO group peptidase (beta-lactamase class C family)